MAGYLRMAGQAALLSASLHRESTYSNHITCLLLLYAAAMRPCCLYSCIWLCNCLFLALDGSKLREFTLATA